MNTVFTTSPLQAANYIKSGGLVAFPTETVYGLGANVFDVKAIKRIFKVKKRPADNPLIAHVSSIEQIRELTTEITEISAKFIDKFFPGPLTLVLGKSSLVPLIATAGLDTIGVRMPRLDVAREFLSACGTPVVAPSANLSGRPSATRWGAVAEDMFGRIDCILQGDAAEIGLESTVVDCTEETPVLLRQGAIPIEELRKVVADTRVFRPVDDDIVKSPGLKHRHYSPRAKVMLFNRGDEIVDSERAAFIGLNKQDCVFEEERICKSVDEYARDVYEFLRRCDRLCIDTIYCEGVPESGIGSALMDRIRRAAQD
jgi:L-threonylcarbamoyladenylate synthase